MATSSTSNVAPTEENVESATEVVPGNQRYCCGCFSKEEAPTGMIAKSLQRLNNSWRRVDQTGSADLFPLLTTRYCNRVFFPETSESTAELREQSLGVHDVFRFVSQARQCGFGKTYVASFKNPEAGDRVMCLKILQQTNLLATSSIRNEAMCLRKLQGTPFFRQILATFQTASGLCLVTDIHDNFTIADLVEKVGILERADVRFLASEITCALSFLHERGIIHRSLSAYNTSVDVDGHVVLFEMGFLTFLPTTNLTLFDGPPYYFVAPEMVKGEIYNKSVDWWAMGVIVYYCLHDRMPFSGNDDVDTLYKIIKGQPIFVGVSDDNNAIDFCKALLAKKPRHRLGRGIQDAEGVKEHPFFEGVDWEKVATRQAKPPSFPEGISSLYFLHPCPGDMDKSRTSVKHSSKMLSAHPPGDQVRAKGSHTPMGQTSSHSSNATAKRSLEWQHASDSYHRADVNVHVNGAGPSKMSSLDHEGASIGNFNMSGSRINSERLAEIEELRTSIQESRWFSVSPLAESRTRLSSCDSRCDIAGRRSLYSDQSTSHRSTGRLKSLFQKNNNSASIALYSLGRSVSEPKSQSLPIASVSEPDLTFCKCLSSTSFLQLSSINSTEPNSSFSPDVSFNFSREEDWAFTKGLDFVYSSEPNLVGPSSWCKEASSQSKEETFRSTDFSTVFEKTAGNSKFDKDFIGGEGKNADVAGKSNAENSYDSETHAKGSSEINRFEEGTPTYLEIAGITRCQDSSSNQAKYAPDNSNKKSMAIETNGRSCKFAGNETFSKENTVVNTHSILLNETGILAACAKDNNTPLAEAITSDADEATGVRGERGNVITAPTEKNSYVLHEIEIRDDKKCPEEENENDSCERRVRHGAITDVQTESQAVVDLSSSRLTETFLSEAYVKGGSQINSSKGDTTVFRGISFCGRNVVNMKQNELATYSLDHARTEMAEENMNALAPETTQNFGLNSYVDDRTSHHNKSPEEDACSSVTELDPLKNVFTFNMTSGECSKLIARNAAEKCPEPPSPPELSESTQTPSEGASVGTGGGQVYVPTEFLDLLVSTTKLNNLSWQQTRVRQSEEKYRQVCLPFFSTATDDSSCSSESDSESNFSDISRRFSMGYGKETTFPASPDTSPLVTRRYFTPVWGNRNTPDILFLPTSFAIAVDSDDNKWYSWTKMRGTLRNVIRWWRRISLGKHKAKETLTSQSQVQVNQPPSLKYRNDYCYFHKSATSEGKGSFNNVSEKNKRLDEKCNTNHILENKPVKNATHCDLVSKSRSPILGTMYPPFVAEPVSSSTSIHPLDPSVDEHETKYSVDNSKDANSPLIFKHDTEGYFNTTCHNLPLPTTLLNHSPEDHQEDHSVRTLQSQYLNDQTTTPSNTMEEQCSKTFIIYDGDCFTSGAKAVLSEPEDDDELIIPRLELPGSPHNESILYNVFDSTPLYGERTQSVPLMDSIYIKRENKNLSNAIIEGATNSDLSRISETEETRGIEGIESEDTGERDNTILVEHLCLPESPNACWQKEEDVCEETNAPQADASSSSCRFQDVPSPKKSVAANVVEPVLADHCPVKESLQIKDSILNEVRISDVAHQDQLREVPTNSSPDADSSLRDAFANANSEDEESKTAHQNDNQAVDNGLRQLRARYARAVQDRQRLMAEVDTIALWETWHCPSYAQRFCVGGGGDFGNGSFNFQRQGSRSPRTPETIQQGQVVGTLTIENTKPPVEGFIVLQ